MAFKGVVFSWFLLLVVVACTLFFFLMRPAPDFTATPSEDVQASASTQKRQGAEKTILLNEGEDRRFGKISSDFSELFYSQSEEGTSLAEKMEGVRLLYQEELLKDAQVVAAMQADSALFRYKEKSLAAENVILKRYQVPGHSVPNLSNITPFFEANAQKLTVSFEEGSSDLFAIGLQGGFKDLHAMKSPFVHLDCKGHILECQGTDADRVLYTDLKSASTLECDRLEIALNEKAPWIEKAEAIGGVELKTAKGDRLSGRKAVMTREGQVTMEGRSILYLPSGEQIAMENAVADLNHKKVVLQGKSVLSIFAPEKRTITSYGEIVVKDGVVAIDSPSTNGVVSEELQIHLEDPRGEIFADRARLSFQEKEGKRRPEKLILMGNIRLLYQSQYALADEAELDFEKGILLLSAKERGSVLFYDRLNGMQATAPQLILSLDPQKKVSVRAIGKMRLLFKEDELTELKKRFSLDGL